MLNQHRQAKTGHFRTLVSSPNWRMTEAVPDRTVPLLSPQEQEVYALLLCGGDPHHPSLQAAGRDAATLPCTDAATVLHRVLSIVAELLASARGGTGLSGADSSSDGDVTDEEYDGWDHDRPAAAARPRTSRSTPSLSRHASYHPYR